MATVNGLTKERMLEIEAASIVDGEVDVNGYLILEKHDGSTINAGNIKGTRTGHTGTWIIGEQANVSVTFDDGLPPRIGDLVIGTNGFDVGQLTYITAVQDATHATLKAFSPNINVKGPKGDKGDTGDTGAAGANADWMSGSGVPDSGLGLPGDWYLDEDTSDVYQKDVSNVWQLETNIKGAQGTRWGLTAVEIGGTGVDALNSLVFFPDGDPPRVGDLVWSYNSLSNGVVSSVTAVVDSTHADLEGVGASIAGPAGPSGTPLDSYPVGAVYISVVNTSPATLFGGTWLAMPAGKMLINIDSGDASMDTAMEEGGSKTKSVPAHTHSTPDHTHTTDTHTPVAANTATGTGTNVLRTTAAATTHSHSVASSGGGTTGAAAGSAFDVMNPFVVVYMWRRTA